MSDLPYTEGHFDIHDLTFKKGKIKYTIIYERINIILKSDGVELWVLIYIDDHTIRVVYHTNVLTHKFMYYQFSDFSETSKSPVRWLDTGTLAKGAESSAITTQINNMLTAYRVKNYLNLHEEPRLYREISSMASVILDRIIEAKSLFEG